MDDNKKAFLLKLFLACYLLAILNSFIFKTANDYYFHSNLINPVESRSKIEQFILGVILAPILETWLFQYLPNWVLVTLKVHKKYLLLLLPAVLFGAMHVGYSLLYGICMLVFGLIINYFFLESKARSKNYFWLTALLHAMYN